MEAARRLPHLPGANSTLACHRAAAPPPPPPPARSSLAAWCCSSGSAACHSTPNPPHTHTPPRVCSSLATVCCSSGSATCWPRRRPLCCRCVWFRVQGFALWQGFVARHCCAACCRERERLAVCSPGPPHQHPRQWRPCHTSPSRVLWGVACPANPPLCSLCGRWSSSSPLASSGTPHRRSSRMQSGGQGEVCGGGGRMQSGGQGEQCMFACGQACAAGSGSAQSHPTLGTDSFCTHCRCRPLLHCLCCYPAALPRLLQCRAPAAARPAASHPCGSQDPGWPCGSAGAGQFSCS